MRIAVLVSEYPSKKNPYDNIFVHSQVKALKKKGIEIDVLQIDMRSMRKRRQFGFYKRRYENVNIYVYSIPCGPIPYLLEYISTLGMSKLLKIYLENNKRPDFVHIHFGRVAFYAYRSLKKYNIPYIITEHSSEVLLQSKLQYTAKTKYKRVYKDAKKIIAVSLSLKEQIQKLTNNNIEVIPNIIPDYMFENHEEIQKENPLNFLFISVGSLIKNKSFDLTIKAFAEVVQEDPNAKLIIVGDGAEKKNLNLLVQQLNIQDSVEFKGIVPNNKLPRLYQACDCFVLPSKFETFGVVYLEAMACGIPVIATRCGGPNEFVNNSNGILVDVDDQEELVVAMKRMIKSSDFEPSKIKEYAYNISSTEVVVRKLENVFKQTIIENSIEKC